MANIKDHNDTFRDLSPVLTLPSTCFRWLNILYRFLYVYNGGVRIEVNNVT